MQGKHGRALRLHSRNDGGAEASGGIISLKSESYVRSIKNNIKALDEEISEKQEALFQMGKEISRLEAKIDIRETGAG